MKYKAIFGLVLIIIFSSCKKDEPEKLFFEGVIIDLENNKPIPNLLTKLHLSKVGYHETPPSLYDSTFTDSFGRYYFKIDDYNGFTTYSIRGIKDNYLTKFPEEWRWGKSINNSTANNDTVIIGRESMLKLHIENSTFDSYKIGFNINIPIEFYDSLADYNPSIRFSESEEQKIIIEKYLFDDNNIVYVSWWWDSDVGLIDTTTIEIEMTPMDTSYLEIYLE